MPFKDAEIREGIFTQYQAHLPRPGVELERFVESQCEYFGIDERKCRRLCGEAKGAYDAQFRSGIQTSTQRIGEAMGLTTAEVLDVVRDGMRATRRRELPPLPGDGEGAEPRYEYLPDHRTRLAAADQAAKLLGLNAPKQVQIEATHEHNVHISESQLRADFAALAGGLGLKVVDTTCEVVAGGDAAGLALDSPVEVGAGGS